MAIALRISILAPINFLSFIMDMFVLVQNALIIMNPSDLVQGIIKVGTE